ASPRATPIWASARKAGSGVFSSAGSRLAAGPGDTGIHMMHAKDEHEPPAAVAADAPGASAPRARAVKAVGLMSGGLDSTLAAKVLKDQGVEVIGLNFNTGF